MRRVLPRNLRVVLPFGLALVAAAGCRSPRSVSPSLQQRADMKAKLRVGMTKAEVAAAIGQPSQFRPARGQGMDVAVYKVGDSTLTVYFYQDRLSRTRSSNVSVHP